MTAPLRNISLVALLHIFLLTFYLYLTSVGIGFYSLGRWYFPINPLEINLCFNFTGQTSNLFPFFSLIPSFWHPFFPVFSSFSGFFYRSPLKYLIFLYNFFKLYNITFRIFCVGKIARIIYLRFWLQPLYFSSYLYPKQLLTI